jgi:DNA-binding transcriptional LysR family regulator
MAQAAAAAREAMALSRDALEGELRLSAPVGFAQLVAPALAPLLARHPGLTLRLLVDDRMIDLEEARVDLALRAGRMPDSRWVARRLCGFTWSLGAAPAYLARAGTPRHPHELLTHEWIGGETMSEGGLALALTGPGGEVEQLRVQPRVLSNNQLTVQQLCAAGLGIAPMVRPDAEDAVRSGRLVIVLPEWQLPVSPVWAVTPRRDDQPAKVRHALAALQVALRQLPGAVE